jgi:hypothetical protein
LAQARHEIFDLESGGLLQLHKSAGAGISVRPPPAELGGVAEALALHVVVADLDDTLGAKRHK